MGVDGVDIGVGNLSYSPIIHVFECYNKLGREIWRGHKIAHEEGQLKGCWTK